MYGKVESFVAACRPLKLNAGVKFGIVLMALAALCTSAAAEENTAEDWYQKGQDLWANGSLSEALEAYDMSLSIDPENGDVWLDKALILDILGSTSESEEAYRQAFEFDMGCTNESQEAYRRALDAFDEDLKDDPEGAWSWWGRGVALDGLGMHEDATEAREKAVSIFNQTLKENPDDAETWFDLAEVLVSLLRREEALEAYGKVIELNSPKAASAAISQGILLQELGRYDESLDAFDMAIEQIPEDDAKKLSMIWYDKASLLGILGKYDEAIEALDEAIELDPDDANLWNMQGQYLADQGRYEEAIEALDRATELSPQDEFMWISKGVILANVMGRYGESVEAYERALAIDPEDVGVWTLKGDALRNLGEYEGCIEAYDEVVEIDPESAYTAYAWYGKGLALQALGMTSEADAAFSKATELGYEPPISVLAITNLISVGVDEFIEMANDGDETETFKGLILTIDGAESVVLPEFALGPGERIRIHLGEGESNETDIFLGSDLFLDDVAGNLTLNDSSGTLNKFAAYWTPEETSEYWAEKGRQLQSVESYEDALDALNNATDIDSQNAMAWLSKAQILGPNLGRYNGSLEACNKAIEIDPENPDSWRLRGLILMNLGRDEEALAAFEEAIELDPESGRSWYLKGNLLRYLSREGEAEEAFARAEELGFTSPLEGMIAITNISAEGEDEFIEITNNLDEAKNLKGWTLVVDEDEARSVVLPEYVLKPGRKVMVHFGSGEDSENDLFMESEIVLNDDAASATLRDETGREVSSLGFENLPDGGVMMRMSGGEVE
jgi:tetratricopeptide (TPR) repeat protein